MESKDKITISLEIDTKEVASRIREQIKQVSNELKTEVTKIIREDHFWHQCLNEEVQTQIGRIILNLAEDKSYPTHLNLNLKRIHDKLHKQNERQNKKENI